MHIKMNLSIFDLFSIGIGPSSSHTVGPMKAAFSFVTTLKAQSHLGTIARIKIELFGSLAFTGKGHGTDHAVLLGISGFEPDKIDPNLFFKLYEKILETKKITVCGEKEIFFNIESDLIFNYKDLLPMHTNGMRFTALDSNDHELIAKIYYSIGGGFILTEDNSAHAQPETNLPHPFSSAKTLLNQCETHSIDIKTLVLKNECAFRTQEEVYDKLRLIIKTMRECINRGCEQTGVLPGGLNVKRRANMLQKKLLEKGKPRTHEHADSMEWLNLFAMAVNEENAASGRVVTAPTNGAAGIVPAVLVYYLTFYPEANEKDGIDFLLTAGAIAILCKRNASISGAEVGCQGEVGVACSMAAAGLVAVLGGNIYQIENAAEIAMEHHLGLTCDPINGLVQIPCIERNAMGAVKAVNAARLALLGDGEHYVSLDKVIATMRQTGKDMLAIYKETSQGGLAVNLPEC